MVAEYLLQMVRRVPPPGAPVVPGSTPVVAFGDPSRAEVATLGINPSDKEFLEGGQLLGSDRRRLATLESLGATRLDLLSDDQVDAVVADCATYFHRHPYRRWFDPLDRLLKSALEASYCDGTACHLDLVQWATRPTWGKITDQAIRRALLEDGAPHLKAQLAHENVRLILLNGRQVIDEVQRLRLVDLREHGGIRFRDGICRLYTGVGGSVRWAAWSTNLQSSWGVSAAFKQDLGSWLADIDQTRVDPGAPSDGEPVATINTLGHLSPAMSISGKSELVEVLTRWLATSSAVTIGDIQKFAGKPWLMIQLGQQRVALNADTKRTAVETFLRESADEPERPWRVIANLRGRINKVVPGPAPLPGWYAYLDHPLDEEGTI